MRLILLVMLSLAFSNSIAQIGDSSKLFQDSSVSIFDYLIQQEIAEVSIKTDMKQLCKNKFNEVYQGAYFSFLANDTTKLSFEIKVRTRGNMRKKACQFPSLKLNFSKSDLKTTGFKPIDKYKLVCQCSSGKAAEQLLLKEYLAYKLYNIITDNSFKVHLFTINYIDSRKKKTRKRYGFLIESEKELADRLDGVELEADSVNLKEIKRDNIIQMGMFQYMIGNSDYSLANMHNLKAIKLKNSNVVVLIAYDFDYSGLVDAKYAIPNPILPIRDVKDRWFNIKGCSRNEIERQIDYFQAHKGELLNYHQSFTILNKNSYYTSLNYVSEFFKIIESPAVVNSPFIRK